MLLVVSKIKTMAKAAGLRTSAEFLEKLSEEVQNVVIQAAKNAKAAEMGTIKDRHMPKIVLEEPEE